MALTLMAVHAHPDDEATGTGGVLARYAAEGVRTVLVTCTDGRCGDAPGGVKPGDPGHDPEAVVAMRRAELEQSCKVLGVTDLELLGYHDSGMMGWPNNAEPGAFWNTPVDDAAERLAELMRHYQPDVVVTYDPNGFYGHPDHIQAHRITMRAVELTGIPRKLYWTTVPREQLAEFGRLMRELGADWDEPEGSAGEGPGPDIGLPAAEVTTWIDTTAFAEQKFDALAAHASQEENIFFLRMGKQLFAEVMGTETFVRVQDSTDADLPEDDLFAGIG
ncbi:MAG TPA: PIG-L family deacetylase [Jatrophihabitans sp.]|nr:PIG-L family deacetylase [Jatrophihabitans sp.]